MIKNTDSGSQKSHEDYKKILDVDWKEKGGGYIDESEFLANQILFHMKKNDDVSNLLRRLLIYSIQKDIEGLLDSVHVQISDIIGYSSNGIIGLLKGTRKKK